MDSITRKSECPRCGKSLPLDAAEGLCAACLMLAGSETLTTDISGDAPTMVSIHDGSPDGGPERQFLEPGQSWGPYRIGRLLGKGGMGEVYEAEHLETGRRLALKVLRSQLRNAEDRARFLREGQLAASVSHPHTVYIFGSEEIVGSPTITMELVPGGTLKDRVVARGPLPSHEAVAAILDIIGGLDAAQSVGVLHRDIKPSNCFFDETDGSVKVGDFGLSISTLARDVHQDFATTGFQGTPQFAAPEQLRGEPLDVRADIYAVGATLYYLLTGKPTFEAHDLRELFARVTSEPPKSPRLFHPDMPAGLALVVLQCLAKTPAERPASYAALANALQPFALPLDKPAKFGTRVLAGAIDTAILSAPVSMWVALTSDLLNQASGSSPTIASWMWLLHFLYYVLLEGIWGASLGKRLLGLRVTAPEGGRASWPRIALRTGIFYMPNMILGASTLAGVLNADSLPAIVRSISSLALVLLLWLPARRGNGWSGIHDLASGLRVVSRSRTEAHRLGMESGSSSNLLHLASATAGRRLGPFTITSNAISDGDARLHTGFDAVLRRPVWLHEVPPGTPPIDAARRDVSRIGRLHWLTGRRSDAENWDAFEAPAGQPFIDVQRATSWSTVKLWLLDLANELVAGTRDSSLPRLGLSRLWLRNDGRLVLLDFRAPGCASTSELDRSETSPTPSGLLSAVATGALSTSETNVGLAMPLSARALVYDLASPTPPSLDVAHSRLIEAAAAPDKVARWRRMTPIAAASVPIVLMLLIGVLVVPRLYDFMNQNAEMLSLLETLHNPRQGSPVENPEIRDAMETYVAGRYGAILGSDAFWNSRVMQSFQERRRTANELLARHPSVSAEELARVSAMVSPDLERIRMRGLNQRRNAVGVGSVIVGFVTGLAALFSMICSLISSIAMPGGAVPRILGLAVVGRDGREIGRGRSFVRTLLAWLPLIIWLLWLTTSPRIQGFVPTRVASVPALALTFGVLAAGAIWAVASPSRGLHDRLAGTWVVPR